MSNEFDDEFDWDEFLKIFRLASKETDDRTATQV